MATPLFGDIHYGYYPPRDEQAKTANYTISAKEAGTMFTNAGASGAVVFTLPTLSPYLLFYFRVVADQDVTVGSAAGNDMVAYNDVDASSVAFSTGTQKIGGGLCVFSNAAGTDWHVVNMSAGANTITVA